MMNHVNTLAKQHGQKGAIPTVYHGTVRTDNPILAPDVDSHYISRYSKKHMELYQHMFTLLPV